MAWQASGVLKIKDQTFFYATLSYTLKAVIPPPSHETPPHQTISAKALSDEKRSPSIAMVLSGQTIELTYAGACVERDHISQAKPYLADLVPNSW